MTLQRYMQLIFNKTRKIHEAVVTTHGMTLIEVVVYISLLSILLTVFLSSIYMISDQGYKDLNNIHQYYEN